MNKSEQKILLVLLDNLISQSQTIRGVVSSMIQETEHVLEVNRKSSFTREDVFKQKYDSFLEQMEIGDEEGGIDAKRDQT